MKYDDAPIWDADAETKCEFSDNGELLLTFNKASDRLAVHDYKISVRNNLGIEVCRKTVLSDYFFQGTPDKFTVNLGKVKLKKLRLSTAVMSFRHR